jgi:hypothetical protein
MNKMAGKLPGKRAGRDFAKGHDARRNLKGRPPKGHAIAEKLRELIDPGKVARVIIRKALSGDPRMIEILIERVEGKVTDVIMTVSETFEDSDLMADRTLLWLTKYHPKLVKEWAKMMGIDLSSGEGGNGPK